MDGNWKQYYHRAHKDREALERLQKSVYPRRMDTQHNPEIARRQKILAFWRTHGDGATADAFGVSRRTLYYWQSRVAPVSRAHASGYRKRTIPRGVEDEINRIRRDHPRLGKEKLAPLLRQFCRAQGLAAYSEPTVGRILRQLKDEGKLAAPVKLRMDARTGGLKEKKPALHQKKERRGGYLPERPGDLLQLDGVLKIVEGKRRYVFTAVDLKSRAAFTLACPSASSRHGKVFLEHILKTAPFPVARIQTDNGGEFLKEFRAAAVEADLVHFFNYAKQPKYQGWVERFNRTIQEEFIDWHLGLLADDLEGFNRDLARWTAWYNGERVHRGLNQKTLQGVQKRTPLQYLALTTQCKRG